MLLIFIPPSSSSTWRHPIHSTERALFSRMDEHIHILFLPGKSHIIRNQNYSRYYRQWVRNAYISRPSPRTISSRRRFILGISKPVGSSHYDDAARWKMRGTDDFLLHEEKILPSDASSPSTIPAARNLFLAAVTRIFARICLVAWKYLLCQRIALRV